MDKPPCVELGREMNYCARSLHRAHVEGHVDLPTQWWKGWRVIKGKLIGPGGLNFTPDLLRALWREERHRHAAPGETPTR